MLIIERVTALSKAPLFAHVHDHALAELAQIVREVTFEAGDTIIREGSLEAWMYVLVEGEARVAAGGVELARIGPGAAVGELALIDPAPRAASVTALEPCLLFRIDQAPFREVMEEQPEVVNALLVTLTRQLRAARPAPAAE